MSANLPPINDILGNYAPALIALYGVPGAGKTCLCLHAALHFLQQGKKVIFVDTERGLSLERFQQLAGEHYQTYLQSLILFLPHSFKHQHETIQQVFFLVTQGNIALVIVDTLSYYYRRFMKNRQELG